MANITARNHKKKKDCKSITSFFVKNTDSSNSLDDNSNDNAVDQNLQVQNETDCSGTVPDPGPSSIDFHEAEPIPRATKAIEL